ncbi:beta-ketoacyl-ACP synthase III [Nocardia sp. alder85J]|uniref:beta-ketoacyl-ACP synthase III n=1 Tax=Nocardia sp. alder85J TaxID=2862949 RepID=UPI001CD77CC8|nr:beta-ketoacyl-ACP synthase III [Nocardia sp. alder85J]MCX4097504.1 ketoacyl-ACP synthase III [Nocardia sp. alder85J]
MTGAGRTAVLAGIGSCVPDRIVTNDDLARTLDTSDAWIRTRTGVGERRFADAGAATSDLAAAAGILALKSAGVAEVDLVLLATATPDRPCPATAPTVAAKMGLDTVAAFDLAAVCSGFVYGLAVAAAMIESGRAQRLLLIAADTFSTILDPDDRTTMSVFGDGAGAVVLRAGTPDEPGALGPVQLGSDGALADMITVRAGGSEQRALGVLPDTADAYFRMAGKPVFMQAVERMTAASLAVLRDAGRSIAEVDRLVGHQANIRILHAVADQLGIDRDKAVVHLDRVGNTAGASIPLALADGWARGELRPGDCVLLTAFGGGATWGASVLTWPELATP